MGTTDRLKRHRRPHSYASHAIVICLKSEEVERVRDDDAREGRTAAGAGTEADAGSDKARVAPELPAARPDQPGHVRVLTEPKTR